MYKAYSVLAYDGFFSVDSSVSGQGRILLRPPSFSEFVNQIGNKCTIMSTGSLHFESSKPGLETAVTPVRYW